MLEGPERSQRPRRDKPAALLSGDSVRRIFVYFLIVLAPLAGFAAGVWLTPRPRLLWKQSLPNRFHSLVGVSKDGSSVLLAVNTDTGVTQALLRYSTADGSVLESIELPPDLIAGSVRPSQYRADMNCVFLEGKHRTWLGQFDLTSRTIIRRFGAGPRQPLYEIISRGNALLVGGAGSINSTLLAWRNVNNSPSHGNSPVVEILHQTLAHTARLHPAGHLATLVGYVQDTKTFFFAVVDLNKKVIAQKLEGTFHDTAFWDDPNRFAVIRYDKSGFFWERYALHDGSWSLEAREKPLTQRGRSVSVQGNSFVVNGVADRPGWFKVALSWLPDDWRQWLYGRWDPPPTEVKLVDVQTGRVTKQFLLPDFNVFSLTLLPDESTVITQGPFFLTAWTAPDRVTWPLGTGLAVGLAASVLLWRYRRRNVDAASPPRQPRLDS
jgi:hypothetical protein